MSKFTRVHFNVYTEDLVEFDKVAAERRLSRSDLIREGMLNIIRRHKDKSRRHIE